MAHSLTADVCAYAVIAACKVFKTDPRLAWSSQRGLGRSALMAAASATQKVTGARRDTIARVFGIHPVSLYRCEREAKPIFLKASQAAWNAIPTDDAVAEPGTVAAPRPVAQEVPAREPVNHMAAIAEAMARRRAKGVGTAFEVAGVEADKALIGATEPGGCVWPARARISQLPGRPTVWAHVLRRASEEGRDEAGRQGDPDGRPGGRVVCRS